MKIRTFALISFLIMSFSTAAFGNSTMIANANSSTAQQVWDDLLKVNNGLTVYGKCRIQDATACASCACTYYFKSAIVGTYGHTGWPKNPSSGDSTGCMNGCWGGYTPAMCTSDMKNNVKAMLLDALANNACGTPPAPPVVKGGVGIMDSSKLMFVKPGSSCLKPNEIGCGTVALGSAIGDTLQFTKLPSTFCNAALAVVEKKMASGKNVAAAKMISCDQLNKLSIDNSTVQQAASILGALNADFDGFSLKGLQKYLDMDQAQLDAIDTTEVALIYVALGENSNKMFSGLKARVKTPIPATRESSDKFIIESEVVAARSSFETISKGAVKGKQFSLEDAVKYLKGQSVANK